MAGMFDDLLSYLMGGTQMGNFLGVGSPTASTQTPVIGPLPGSPTLPGGAGPMLGGAPAPAGGGGLLSGLLGGQAPVNAASYFQPKPGLLGDSPLGNALRGGFAGLSSVQPGMKGLGAIGAGAQGGIQEEQQRQQRQMATALAGQQYKQGQQALITGNLTNQLALEKANIFRRHYGLPDLTMDQMIADPSLAYATSPAGGQPQAGGQSGGGGAAAPTQPAAPAAPIDPTVLPPSPPTPTIPSPTGVGTNVQPRNAIDQFKQATLQFEGGGDPNAVDPKSGAIAGLTQGTFDLYNKKFFGGKLNFANTADRQAVNNQLINDLYQQAGGDVNRMAAGYFTGQMAPQGSPTPWVDPNATDANGTNVVDYVNHIRKNLMLPPIDAGGATAQGQPAAGGQATGGGQQAGDGSQQTIEDAIAAGRVPPLLADAYQSAWDTGDLGKVADAKLKIAEYLAAPQQAAATQQATQGVEFAGPKQKYEAARALADDYKTNKTVLRWGVAKPAADAFNLAYQDRPTAGGSSDYALVEAALQVFNPDVAVAKPGSVEYATQLQTLPGKIQDAIQSFISGKSALSPDTVEQLKKAVEQRMAINKKLIDKTNASFSDRAQTDAPGVKPTYWNPEGYGLEDQGGTTQTADAGGQAPSTGQPAAPAKPQWTQDRPATLGAGANEQARLEWFDHLPLGSVYVNPDPPHQQLTKTMERPGKK